MHISFEGFSSVPVFHETVVEPRRALASKARCFDHGNVWVSAALMRRILMGLVQGSSELPGMKGTWGIEAVVNEDREVGRFSQKLCLSR